MEKFLSVSNLAIIKWGQDPSKENEELIEKELLNGMAKCTTDFQTAADSDKRVIGSK